MIRVGYPAVYSSELLRDFPEDVELIPLPDGLDHTVEIDVWIPNPYPTRAIPVWPHLRGVKLVLSLMAGRSGFRDGWAARNDLQRTRGA